MLARSCVCSLCLQGNGPCGVKRKSLFVERFKIVGCCRRSNWPSSGKK
jgi:hypothetical protein